MVLFPVIGLLLWIAFLFAVMVLAGIFWALGSSILWLLDFKVRLDRRGIPIAPKRSDARPVAGRAEAQPAPEIWPKWNAARRRTADRELSVWQEQFDALNSPKG